MEDKLYDLKVTDKRSFIEFLKLLKEDFARNQEEWENTDLESFLEAMAAYTEDAYSTDNSNTDNGSSRKIINLEKPSWELFADILKGAILYE